MMTFMNDGTHAAELERAIDLVAESYKTELEINNLKSADLPNRKAVIDAYSHLLASLFLGFYSKRALNIDNLRHTLSEALYPAYEGLVRQIERAATYEEGMGRRVSQGPHWAASVVLKLLGVLPELRSRLNSDVLAAYDGDPAVRSVEEVVFSLPGLRAITAHRVAHFLHVEGVPIIPRIISEYAHSQTGIDIHAGAQIGDQFFIDHGTGVVIGETTVIGNNVKIYQEVTLGALSIPRNQRQPTAIPEKRHPTIEDDVTIYSGAKILGGQTVIGKGSVIGANAWLMQSVAPGTRIMGRQSD
jgi:serine O-acetyltransferase